MLVVTRRDGEAIVITPEGGPEIKVVMIRNSGSTARVGVIAPPSVAIDREEIHLKKREGKRRG